MSSDKYSADEASPRLAGLSPRPILEAALRRVELAEEAALVGPTSQPESDPDLTTGPGRSR